jgi:hypothetical protein
METLFPYVELPPEMAEVIGKREGNSRIYTQNGTEEGCAPWYDALSEIVGRCVSPGGVTMYCPVSRAAVHRRLREGRLSCFTYFVEERKINFFGKLREFRGTPYQYIPVSECKAWRKELEEKALRNELVTAEELEGTKPDWEADFLKWDSRWRKEQRKLGGPRNIPVTIKLAPKEVECLERLVTLLKDDFPTKEDFITHLINYTTMEGMSGLSFTKFGFRLARMHDEADARRKEEAK